MAYEVPGFKLGTLVAGEDLSGKQYYFVEVAADGDVELGDAVTDRVIGVLQNKPTAGQECEIMVTGVSKIRQAASINPGVAVGTDAAGLAAANATTTGIVKGIMLENGGAANAYGSILLGAQGSFAAQS
jgi:hypothetical protein